MSTQAEVNRRTRTQGEKVNTSVQRKSPTVKVIHAGKESVNRHIVSSLDEQPPQVKGEIDVSQRALIHYTNSRAIVVLLHPNGTAQWKEVEWRDSGIFSAHLLFVRLQRMAVHTALPAVIGKGSNLTELQKGMIIGFRPKRGSISKTATFVNCSRASVVKVYRECTNGTIGNNHSGNSELHEAFMYEVNVDRKAGCTQCPAVMGKENTTKNNSGYAPVAFRLTVYLILCATAPVCVHTQRGSQLADTVRCRLPLSQTRYEDTICRARITAKVRALPSCDVTALTTLGHIDVLIPLGTEPCDINSKVIKFEPYRKYISDHHRHLSAFSARGRALRNGNTEDSLWPSSCGPTMCTGSRRPHFQPARAELYCVTHVASFASYRVVATTPKYHEIQSASHCLLLAVAVSSSAGLLPLLVFYRSENTPVIYLATPTQTSNLEACGAIYSLALTISNIQHTRVALRDEVSYTEHSSINEEITTTRATQHRAAKDYLVGLTLKLMRVYARSPARCRPRLGIIPASRKLVNMAGKHSSFTHLREYLSRLILGQCEQRQFREWGRRNSTTSGRAPGRFHQSRTVRGLGFQERTPSNSERSVLGVRIRSCAHLGERATFAATEDNRRIVLDDAIDWRFFSEISCFTRPCITALLHSYLTTYPSALKTSILRAAQISSLGNLVGTKTLGTWLGFRNGAARPVITTGDRCRLKSWSRLPGLFDSCARIQLSHAHYS
ncbi:hypothetical protein PR048_006069 [Dryococelus australis]|uniref:Uncharacterized protein n=1 Tax=Dryococelus australis TaxID=614101 RepID=A0ABQ9I9Z5_9NEOP|nr:hypothetical protein PR048_006069 [Dryococelus australis]